MVERGMVCLDCALILANGEDGCEDECEHGAGLPIHTVLDGDSEPYYHPTWRPCPGCGTRMAGEWFPYAVLD
jgi:hypothetical protein